MDELIVQSEISNHIYTIRNEQVMIDRDLAEFYGVETKRINEAVRNNKDKFPSDFYFELSDKEFIDLRSKISTANFSKTRTNPKVFTEQGVYMLATVINSSIAIDVSKNIMRTFTKLREFSKHYNSLAKQLIEIDRKHDKQYKELKKSLDELIATSEVADVAKIGFLK